MPYLSSLKQLLEEVDGTVGLGFADYDGETIQLAGAFGEYEHRVLLACQGILLEHLKKIHHPYFSPPSSVLATYQNFTVALRPLKDGYYLVLTLAHRKYLHEALRRLEELAVELSKDLV